MRASMPGRRNVISRLHICRLVHYIEAREGGAMDHPQHRDVVVDIRCEGGSPREDGVLILTSTRPGGSSLRQVGTMSERWSLRNSAKGTSKCPVDGSGTGSPATAPDCRCCCCT